MEKSIFEKLENFKSIKLDPVHQTTSNKVKIVRHISDPRKVFAIKIHSKEDKREIPFFIREIKIHKSLSHPNIIKYYHSLEDKKNIYLFMEFAAGGNL